MPSRSRPCDDRSCEPSDGLTRETLKMRTPWRISFLERSSRARSRFCRQRAARLLTVVLALTVFACKERFAAEQPFLREPLPAQRAAFEKMAPGQQVRVFLATRASELPDDHLCEQLGKSGDRAVPEILKAILEEKEDREKRSLLRALACVHRDAERCDPRVAPVALSVAKSVLDKDERGEAMKQADALRCR